MRDLLRGISVHYAKSNSNDEKLTKYDALKRHEGWEVHKEMLLVLRGMIADDLLSAKFTNMNSRDKDALQRGYSYANELIGFLLNPLDLAVKRAKFNKGFDQINREATKLGSNP